MVYRKIDGLCLTFERWKVRGRKTSLIRKVMQVNNYCNNHKGGSKKVFI